MSTATLAPVIMAVGYTRVSTEKQAAEDRTSLAEQKRMIEEYARARGLTIGRWFEDAGVSGGTAERPAFAALRAFCQENRRSVSAPALVVCLNNSRFGRFENLDHYGALRFEFFGAGWEVTYVQDNGGEGPMGHMLRAMKDAASTDLRNTIKVRTRDGMAAQRNAGNWPGREPYGYRRRSLATGHTFARLERKQPTERVKLVPDEREAATVRWIFETYAAGGTSLTALAQELERRDPGTRAWGLRSISQILSNRTYLGEVHSRTGAGRPGAHEAVVDLATFNAVQARLAGNKAEGKAVRGDFWLSGVLRCYYCGAPYIGGGTQGSGASKHRVYRDSGAMPRRPGHARPCCPGAIGSVRQALVEERTLEVLAETVGRPEVQAKVRAELDALMESMATGEPTAEAEHELARLTQEEDRLMHAVVAGVFTTERAAPLAATLRRAREEAVVRLEGLRAAGASGSALRGLRDAAVERAANFRAMVAGLSGAALRSAVLPWLAGAVFDKVERSLMLAVRLAPAGWNGVPVDAPRSNRSRSKVVLPGNSRTQPAREHDYLPTWDRDAWRPEPLPFGTTSWEERGGLLLVRTSLLNKSEKSVRTQVRRMRAELAGGDG